MAERVALLAEGSVVGTEVLDGPSLAAGLPATAVSSAGSATAQSGTSLDDVMRQHLLAALTQTAWNISRTAALLGISRNTLRARIEKYGLRTYHRSPARSRPKPAAEGRHNRPTPESVPVPGRIRWERRRITLLVAELMAQASRDEPSSNSRELEALTEKVGSFGGHVHELGQNGI